jgi:hypothetical protein
VISPSVSMRFRFGKKRSQSGNHSLRGLSSCSGHEPGFDGARGHARKLHAVDCCTQVAWAKQDTTRVAINELDGESFIIDAKYKRHWEELSRERRTSETHCDAAYSPALDRVAELTTRPSGSSVAGLGGSEPSCRDPLQLIDRICCCATHLRQTAQAFRRSHAPCELALSTTR